MNEAETGDEYPSGAMSVVLRRVTGVLVIPRVIVILLLSLTSYKRKILKDLL
jgi:hypothetical protein